MMIVVDWFTGLATIGGFLYFLAGFGFAYLFHCVRAKLRHRDVKVPWHLAGITVGLVAMTVVIFQTQIAYTTAKDTAQEVQDCQREFFEALQARSAITSDNDRLSLIQREALADWIHDLILPPPEVAKLGPNDPARQAFNFRRTEQAYAVIEAAQEEQRANDAERAANPYPEPTCGR